MFEPGQDQASGLRQLLQLPPLRLLPVVGAGAAGDAARVAADIARAFALHGCRTLLVGAGAEGGGCPGPGVAVHRVPLPARLHGSGSPVGAAAWLEALPIAHKGYELAVVAAPEALLGPMLARLRPETLVLCGPLREDLAGAYALVKRLARGHGFRSFRLLFDGLSDPALALRRQRRLAGVAARYLGVDVRFAGTLACGAAPGSGGADMTATATACEAAGTGVAPVARAARDWPLAAVGARRATLH